VAHPNEAVVLRFADAMVARDVGSIADLHDVLANDRHVVVLSDRRARRGSREVEMRAASIYHVRDEKIAEAWLMEWDPYAIDGFFTD
jgi:ketosteroid isomerase-like protein